MHREGTETLTSDNISKHQVTFLSLIFVFIMKKLISCSSVPSKK